MKITSTRDNNMSVKSKSSHYYDCDQVSKAVAFTETINILFWKPPWV